MTSYTRDYRWDIMWITSISNQNSVGSPSITFAKPECITLFTRIFSSDSARPVSQRCASSVYRGCGGTCNKHTSAHAQNACQSIPFWYYIHISDTRGVFVEGKSGNAHRTTLLADGWRGFGGREEGGMVTQLVLNTRQTDDTTVDIIGINYTTLTHMFRALAILKFSLCLDPYYVHYRYTYQANYLFSSAALL